MRFTEMARVRRIGICLAVFAAGAPASARDIFVNNLGGNDTLDGASHLVEGADHGPLRTLRKAMMVADPGDVIRIIPTSEPLREEIAISGARQRGGLEPPPVAQAHKHKSSRPVFAPADGGMAFSHRSAPSSLSPIQQLEAEIREQRFRHDLYYRINVARISIPALHERTEDFLCW